METNKKKRNKVNENLRDKQLLQRAASGAHGCHGPHVKVKLLRRHPAKKKNTKKKTKNHHHHHKKKKRKKADQNRDEEKGPGFSRVGSEAMGAVAADGVNLTPEALDVAQRLVAARVHHDNVHHLRVGEEDTKNIALARLAVVQEDPMKGVGR